MPTFVYAPSVTAHVEVTNKQGQAEIVDISNDLTAGQMNLRTNGVHLFQFKLQNSQRKYDGLIRPMDRIVISMSRIGAPLRVFSGYMNNGPIFSVWPRVLNMTASCTIKKLQFWYWDSSSNAAQTLITSWQQLQANQSTQTKANQGNQPNAADGGIRDMVIQLLTEVVGWPQEKIHIGAIPTRWFDFATSVGDEIIKAADESALIGTLGGSASVGGSTLTANGSLPPGTYAGVALNQDQANNAATIFNVAVSRGLTSHDAALGIGCAMQESSLVNLHSGSADSVGLFQQRPSQGWGTVAQIEDPQYSAGKFFDALIKVPNYETLPFTVVIQDVQRSGNPNAYAQWENLANACVQVLQKNNTSSTNAGILTQGSTTIGSGGATGENIASVSYNLIKSHPPGYIRYREGGDSAYNDPDPRILDCSSFVDWVFYHTTGRPLNPSGQRSVAASIGPQCINIDQAAAKNIKGALLFLGGVGAETHVEVSLGNGYTAAAHTDQVPLAQQVDVGQAGNFTHGGLLPGINYSNSATTAVAANLIQAVEHYKASTSDPNQFGPNAPASSVNPTNQTGANTGDPFNALINVYTWGFNPSNDADIFAGPRAMMNDEPILPYISNLLGASMRSWCSAPNGDFMAWFPDYFNIWGISAVMNVRAIELMDFTVDWSDQQIVTHQYVVGVPQGMFDTASGSVSAYDPTGGQGQLYWELTTQGVATMDFPQIFRAIFGQDATTDFVNNYLSRFGGRPNMVTIPTISQGRPEFFMALYLFMQRWANQFQANVPMTFMPELWPGMILRLPEFNFQAYISEVQHNFQFGPDGGFSTTASISAPARINDQASMFGLLPLGGQVYAQPITPNAPQTPPSNTTGAPPLPLPTATAPPTSLPGLLNTLTGGNP